MMQADLRQVVGIGVIALITVGTAMARPLKIYILAGQSNMEGHAHVDTIPEIGKESATRPLLDMMLDSEGQHRVCERVWISYLTAKKGERVLKEGKLTTGYGSFTKGPKIGPEFTFGLTLEERMSNPVLLIKTAWGGTSLYKNWRPPRAGPIELTVQQVEAGKEKGADLDQMLAKARDGSGALYQAMIEHVQDVLANIKRIYPEYDDEQGYEIAGFVWFQGWNDKVNSGAYPNRDNPGGYDLYTELLAHFIRDIRKDLGVSSMPFVIGVMGQNGPIDINHPRDKNEHKNYYFRKAQAATAELPEFKGGVKVVLTEKYWDSKLGDVGLKLAKVKDHKRVLSRDKSLSKEAVKVATEEYRKKLISDEEMEMYEKGASNAGFHYYGSAKIFAQFGVAFAEALLDGGSK
jgi:alpha-galactosidase